MTLDPQDHEWLDGVTIDQLASRERIGKLSNLHLDAEVITAMLFGDEEWLDALCIEFEAREHDRQDPSSGLGNQDPS